MTDTNYEIFQDGKAYKIRITRLGNFIQEADGFASRDEAERWITRDQRIAVMDERKQPATSAGLRVIKPIKP